VLLQNLFLILLIQKTRRSGMKKKMIIAVWRGVNGVGTRIEKRVTGSTEEEVEMKIVNLIKKYGNGSGSYSISISTPPQK